MTKTPIITDQVLALASDLMDELMTIVEESPKVKALDPEDRTALFICIADGFNDETKD